MARRKEKRRRSVKSITGWQSLSYTSKSEDKKAANHSWRGNKRVTGGKLPQSKDAVDMIT